MNDTIVQIGYQYLYDFVYRVRQGCLRYEIYQLDFLDWVKAGIAYNTLGTKDANRRVEYFARLYRQLHEDLDTVPMIDLQTALFRFYEDIFRLYQDHLVSQLKQLRTRKNKKDLEPDNLILLPDFRQIDSLRSVLPFEEVVLVDYLCKYPLELEQQIPTIYVSTDSTLYKGMSLMYDYGIKREGGGIILGVEK